jgi:type I restriction enzyme S subunit
LGYVARVQGGVTVHGARTETSTDVELPYLRVANVQDGRIDLSEIKTITIAREIARRSTLQPGDVVMTEANGNPNNLGRGAVWAGSIPKMIHQNHIFAIRTDRRSLLPEFLSLILASIHGRRYFRFTSSQVGIATISSAKVLAMPLPILSLDQQRTIVAGCSQLRDATDKATRALSAQVRLLAERRQALITAAATGQIYESTAVGQGIED